MRKADIASYVSADISGNSPLPFFLRANTSLDGSVSRRKLYSAVPGRHFVAVRSYQPQADGEITLYKNDRVKGQYTPTETIIQTYECRFLKACFISRDLKMF